MAGRPLTRVSRGILAELERKHPEWWDGICVRISCGESPDAIALEHRILPGAFMAWILKDEGRRNAYHGACASVSERDMWACRELAEKKKKDRAEVASAGLELETKFKLAEKWYPERYGKQKGEGRPQVLVLDASVLAEANKLLEGG